MPLPSYAIVIVHYGDIALTRDCLRASESCSVAPVLRVVVWNDPAQPAPPDLATAIVLSPERNLGFAGGANLGVAHAIATARPDAIWLLNNDARVRPTAAERLLLALRDDASLAMVGPRIVDATGDRIWHDGGAIEWPSARPVSRGHGAEVGSEPPRCGVDTVDFVCGCAPMLRVACIEAVGTFDERYFLYFEDVDLSVRCRDRGWRLGHLSTAVVEHIGSATVGATTTASRYYRLRSRLLFIAAHAPPRLRARALRTLRVRARWRGGSLLLRGRLAEARAIFAALRDARAERWARRPPRLGSVE